MSKKRYVNDCIWEDPYIMDLDPSEKLLFVYFLTNNKVSICGIYEIHIRKIALETGFDKDMIKKVLDRFENDDKMYYRDGVLFISNFLKNQSLNDNMKKGVQRELSELGKEKLGLFSSLKGFERLGKALKSFDILNLTLLNLSEEDDDEKQKHPKKKKSKAILNVTREVAIERIKEGKVEGLQLSKKEQECILLLFMCGYTYKKNENIVGVHDRLKDIAKGIGTLNGSLPRSTLCLGLQQYRQWKEDKEDAGEYVKNLKSSIRQGIVTKGWALPK